MFGTNISLVDTPGLFDTDTPNDKMILEITRCIWMSSPGPHAILLTIQIGRLTEQVKNTIRMFQMFFGPLVTKYMIVVFTFKDHLKTRRSTKTIEDYVNEIQSPEVKDVLHQCEMRYIAFDNTLSFDSAESKHQVKSLLDMVEKMVLGNGGSHYTNAMLEEAEKRMKEKERQIRKEIEAKAKAKEEEIKKKYEGELRQQMLAAVRKEFEERDARQEARKESESPNWGEMINSVMQALPAFIDLLKLYRGNSASVPSQPHEYRQLRVQPPMEVTYVSLDPELLIQLFENINIGGPKDWPKESPGGHT